MECKCNCQEDKCRKAEIEIEDGYLFFIFNESEIGGNIIRKRRSMRLDEENITILIDWLSIEMKQIKKRRRQNIK